MIHSVDLVISGHDGAAHAVAVDALQRGERVLIVLRAADSGVARRLRVSLRSAASGTAGRLTIATGSEVVCVDGKGAVEAVVMRHVPTGRIWAVNARAHSSFGNTGPP